MLRTWLEPQKKSVPEEFIQAIGGNPLVSQVLYTRGLKDLDAARGFLSADCYIPNPGRVIPGLEKAVGLLREARSNKKIIGVWGDFDVDGQTSTTLFVSALRQLGYAVEYHIPVRAEESHGISLPALQKFLDRGIDLILTCDTGITSLEAVEFANSQGVPVIISDHHDLPDTLPAAQAIVNPKMLPTGHPLSFLPGAGVAYKIVETLYQQEGNEASLSQFLDLVALGIVADIALQRGDTRYLLQRGLEALRHTQRAGLLAIMELTELNQNNLSEEHISFILAPRMNALGRLDDANLMVELLSTTDMGRARTLAAELEGMNAQRKLLSDQVYLAAEAQLRSDPGLLDYPVIVLSHPTWPAGVVGVVASKLVEQYHRPVILLASPTGQDARGSARSIEPINITQAIADNQKLVKGFGGHPMAAGLVIDPDRIPEFRRSISRTVEDLGIGIQVEKDMQIDGYLTLPELNLDLVEDFERLAPFGAGNPPLVFATRNLKLTGYAAVGRAGEHLQLTVEDELGHLQRSIWWQGAGYSLPESKFDLAYSVRASTYRGQREVQLEWIDYRLVENGSILIKNEKKAIQVIDWREDPDPMGRIKQLHGQEGLLLWGEAEASIKKICLDRNSLFTASGLAIVTIPPGINEIRSVLERVKPSQIYLLGLNPGMDEPEAFLKRLVGLLKTHIKRSGGSISLRCLAASSAQTIQAVKSGIEWLDAYGYFKLISVHEDDIEIESGTRQKKENAVSSATQLNTVLAESAAFRRYYLSAMKERMVSVDDEI